MSIKYYHLAKDETPPEEFCAIRDVGGEPSEYMFYVPEDENAKLRKLVQGLWFAAQYLGMNPDGATGSGFARQMRELGIEV